MAAETLKNKTIQEIEKELRDKRTALRDFRFSRAGAGTRNGSEGKNLRRDIARLLTELNTR